MPDLTGLGSIFDFGGKLIDKLFPDPAQRDEAKFKLLELQERGELKEWEVLVQSDRNQTEINKLDAISEKFLQYGWRPYIGWICGNALAYQFLLRPLMTWLSPLLGLGDAPPLDMGDLLTLLAGMLGLAGMRSAEKLKGKKNG